jgi:hypothetical protein
MACESPMNNRDLLFAMYVTMPFHSSEREAGGKTEMGLAASWQVTEGYHARIPGGLCTEYYGKETSNVRSEQS